MMMKINYKLLNWNGYLSPLVSVLLFQCNHEDKMYANKHIKECTELRKLCHAIRVPGLRLVSKTLLITALRDRKENIRPGL